MDFVIISINGRDVSNSSHEEAVRYFETAQEPITIQVLRKQSNRINQQIDTKLNNNEPKKLLNYTTTSVQTELVGLINDDYVDNYYVFEDGDDYDDDQDNEDVEVEEYDEMTNIRDFKLREDVYFEEVTLRKSTSQEKLGLTVCYNYSCEKDNNNSDTAEVYISEILKDSLASRDGRLREGDQILQVNGKDIESKEQTERVFSQTKNTVVILVSRCLYQSSLQNSPDNVPAYQNSMIELLLQHQKRQYENTALNDNNKCDTGVSTTSTTTTTTTTVSSSPPPPVPPHIGINNSLLSSTSTSSSSHNSHTSNNKDTNESIKESIKKIDDLTLNIKTRSTLHGIKNLQTSSDTEHIYETIPESDNEPIYSSPYESKLNIRKNETSTTSTLTTATTTTTTQHEHRSSKSSKSNSSIEEKDSSSAYNTGESCHSNNQLVLELQKSTDSRDIRGSTLVLCTSDNNTPTTPINYNRPPNCDIAENQIVRSLQASLSAPQFNNSHIIDNKKLTNTCQYNCYHRPQSQYQYYYHQPQYQLNTINNKNLNTTWNNNNINNNHYDKDTTSIGSSVMYTNVDNLEQTMMLQQQIFTQALNRKNITKDEIIDDNNDKSKGKFRAPNLTQYHFIGSQQVRKTNTLNMPEDKCDPRMEWKVKRRPDGTRYIVRRPVRNRLLDNRTLEISEERAGQTTEDDTVSEIKLGRYWTKEEKKRHLEQARQRKQRHQGLLRQQLKQHEVLNCDHVVVVDDDTTRKSSSQDTSVNINQTNHNKIDDNINCGGNGKTSIGLLSVTTV
ncbi:hypothetical protein HCN44_010102 [Aphidius gifuensis]|uniref:PDZ domain-containing protein n=1 Tax=Aphidius gifuensis TaxID=684658 RepID=A0A834XVT7_APHGI|nr:slo-interacting protein 1 [Aphidius gifuensis]XP_044006992.1 slo-interacting protein 1 [Aphidius gifuensis]KAF7993507.1 hypothetical protein HCN44_010102 [Aphidius gifuensis]